MSLKRHGFVFYILRVLKKKLAIKTCFIYVKVTMLLIIPPNYRLLKQQSKDTLTRSHSLDSGLNATCSSSSFPGASSIRQHPPPSHSASAFYAQTNSTHQSGAPDVSDIHVCVLCMKALMNNAVSGCGQGRGHKEI